MSELITLIGCSLENNNSNEENQKNNLSEKQIEKVLCDHCGRTAINGIRCMGICVADSDY
tara:strand:- start:398 stop:577 length:180 start_codon:yes stop_codon:yes gene_type:complete